MATISSLGFSIISRYSGGGVAQARRDLTALRAQLATINGDLQRHTNVLGGIPQRWKAIGGAVAAIAPALIPLSAQALATAGAFTAMSVAVGAALGAYGAAMKGAITRTLEMAAAGKKLSPVQKEFVGAVNGMKKAWQDFIKATEGKTLAVATNVVQGLTSGIKLLKPLIDAIHPSLLQVSKDFESWMKGDSAKEYSRIIADIAKTAMPNLVTAGKAVLNVLGDGFRAFAPLAKELSASIRDGALALKSWSDGGGFQRFLAYVKENAPAVQAFWAAFRAALANVFNILKQFSGGVLSVLTDALRAIAAINPESVKAFANALLLLKAPLFWLLVNCPPLRDLIVKLIGAMNPQMIYAVAAAFVALRVAFMIMNTALLTTPLGWIIMGLVALGVAITVIATKTTWFQTAWTYTWNAIKHVVDVIWQALQVAWHATVNAIIVAWQTVSGALVTAWNAVWNAVSTAVRVIWTGLTTAWNAFVFGLSTAWTAVSTALVTAWNFVWNAISTGVRVIWTGLQAGWNAVVMAFTTVWTAVSGALSVAWNFFWNAISTAARLIWSGLQVAWSAFITALSTVWTAVSTALTAAWNFVWNAISTVARGIWTAMQAAWSLFINTLSTIWSTVSAVLSAAWNAVWNAMRTAAQAIWTGMQAAWNAFLTAVQAVWNTAKAIIQAAWNAFWTALKTFAETIWNALRTAWQLFWTTVTTIFNTTKAIIQAAWNAFWTAVKTFAETIWNALKTAWQAFWTAVTTIWNTFKAAFQAAWNALWNAVKSFAEGVWNTIKSLWQGFIDGVKDIWEKASSWIKDKWEDTWNFLKDKARSIWNTIGGVIEGAINGIIKIINTLTGGFNKVAGFLKIGVEIGKIGEVSFPKLANGGMVEFAYGGMTGAPKDLRGGGALRGYAPGRDTIPAVLSRGEGVLTPEAVRGLGGPGFVHGANRTFAGHRGAGKLGKKWKRDKWQGSRWGTGTDNHRHFADGGMVPGVQHFAVGGMTAAALARAGVSLGMVSQGEYSNGALSAGTHAGAGVVDISSTSPALVAALRAAGFAAWARTGPAWAGNEHIHAVLMNHPGLSGPARAQVASFMQGGDGLGAGGGGGSGGGPPAWLEGLLSKAGEILSKVAQGLPLGGLISSIFGVGGDEEKENGKGLFGTGIGPDIGPDLTPGKDLGDALGKVVGGVLKVMIPGIGDLGKLMLGLIPDDAFEFAFKWVTDKLKAFTPGAGGFGDMVIDMGSKTIQGAIKFLIGKNQEKSAEAQAAIAAMSGGGGGGGNVQQWAGLAAQALARAGISASQLPRFLALMQAESGGNPGAQNNYDSNAAMGQASRGLMQVIPSTFAAYRDPSLSGNIFDPLANMTAAARYIKARYGGQVPGSPYATGTPGATRGLHLVGEQGPELMNFAGGETITPAKETASILAGSGEQMFGGATSMPEDMMERFKLLMQLAQQMAAIVQTSWTKVTTSGQTAKSAMTPVFSDLALQLGTTVPGAMTTMSTANTTAWTAMQAGTTAAWTAMRDGTFTEAGDHMSVKMPTWGNEMNSAVSEAWVNMGQATAAAWEGMKEGTRGPTNWIIENSYNNGLARLWNEVATVIFEDGAKQLPTVATLAKGGPVHGPGSGTADRVPAMLSRGEHVWTAQEVRRAGGHYAVQQMRSGVMGKGVRGAHDGSHFALGGWSSPGGISLPGLDELKRGSMMEQAEPFLDALDSGVKSALVDSPFRKLSGITGGTSPSDWMRQYIEKDDELNKIGSGGPPWIPGVSDAITSWGGVTVNQRTADMLNMAMQLGGSFSATQGSFSTGVAASAGTHDGGGVVDLVPASNANVGALRAVGFAAWNRGAAWGSPSFSPHIHAVALGDPTVSAGAAAQVMSYLAGGNGLADGGPDNFSGGIPGGAEGVTPAGGGRNVDPADLEQRVVSYDRGGYLQPGYTLAYNGTGRPEPVGHHLEPKGSKGIEISMPITITGNQNAQEVVDGINAQVLPKLRQMLHKGTGTNS